MKHRPFWLSYAISLYHCGMSIVMPRMVSDRKAIVRYYKKLTGGKAPDLDNPVLFSEKLQWYKINHRDPLMERVANKYTVRGYLEEVGYGHLLNDIYGIYTDVDDIDFDKLPDQFVIKGTHGSGFNIIVKDKSMLNRRQARLMMKSWLRQHIAWSGREWVYEKMPRHIIVEKYLEDETGELRDYKFYCFNGKPAFMQLEVGRATDHNTRNFYDMDWKLMPFGKSLPHNPDLNVPVPVMFDEMKKIAEDLCQPFQYVRVDLYQVGGKIYFGELTFYPAGGAPDFIPSHYDAEVGKMWTLIP